MDITDSERRMLTCLVTYKDCLEKGIADLCEQDFGDIRHKEIFKLVVADYMQGNAIDPIVFYDRNRVRLEYILSGFAGAYLMDAVCFAGEYGQLLQVIRENATKRRITALVGEVQQKLSDGVNMEQINELIERYILDYQPAQNREYLSPEELYAKCLDVVKARMDDDKRSKKVLYTGFRKLNINTGGFENGDLVILSGETGGGKSAFATNIAKDIAIVQKKPVLYLNSEMSSDQMSLRWSSLLSGTSHSDLRNGEISQGEYDRIQKELAVLEHSKLYTVTIPDLKITSVISEIKRAKRQKDIRMAIVDYIGRVDMENATKDDWQMMTTAARKLKTIAQNEDIVVLMIAQLNADGRLARASYMTHEADLWLNLRKPTEKELSDSAWWNMFLEIKKGRNAPTGMFKLNFRGDKLLFCEGAL